MQEPKDLEQTDQQADQSRGDVFSLSKKFPGQPAAAPPRPPEPPRRKRGNPMTRIIVPLVLFFVVIGGIAFITQYLPNWRKTERPKRTQGKTKAKVVFKTTRAVKWDKNDEYYLKEFEAGEEGHVDYQFANESSEPMQLGLKSASCTCARVEAVVFMPEEWQSVKATKQDDRDGWNWTKLEVDQAGIKIPPGAAGFVRIIFNKPDPQPLALNSEIWIKSEETNKKRPVLLETRVRLVQPVRVHPQLFKLTESLDRGGSQTVKFLVWSATRDSLDLSFADLSDPLLEVSAEPVTKEERKKYEYLLDRMTQGNLKTRIKSAHMVEVTLHERKGTKRRHQGYFLEKIPILAKDSGGEANKVIAEVRGKVRGDIEVQSVELGSFEADRGKPNKSFPVLAPQGTIVEVKSWKPPYLKVKLVPSKESRPNRPAWDLKVGVPIGAPGEIKGQIILKTRGTSTGEVAVPVRGNASG